MSPNRKSPTNTPRSGAYKKAVAAATPYQRILFFAIGALGFVAIFVIGLWLTLELPSVARWVIQFLFAITFIYGYTYRLGASLGIISREKDQTLETAFIQHPLSYYLMKGLSLMWLLFIIGFFILIVGGAFSH